MLFVFVGFTAFSKENTDEKLTVHEFKGSEIGGSKENPLGTKIDSKKIENSKTKVNAAKIDIDTKIVPIQNVINEILSKNNVMDISIDDPPLEEIISDIYKKTGAR